MKAVKKGALKEVAKWMLMLLAYDRIVSPAVGTVISKVKGAK